MSVSHIFIAYSDVSVLSDMDRFLQLQAYLSHLLREDTTVSMFENGNLFGHNLTVTDIDNLYETNVNSFVKLRVEYKQASFSVNVFFNGSESQIGWFIRAPEYSLNYYGLDSLQRERHLKEIQDIVQKYIHLIKITCNYFPPSHIGLAGDGEYLAFPDPEIVYSDQVVGLSPINYFSYKYLTRVGTDIQTLRGATPDVCEQQDEGILFIPSIDLVICNVDGWEDYLREVHTRIYSIS